MHGGRQNNALSILWSVGVSILLCPCASAAEQNPDITAADVRAFLRDHIDTAKIHVGIVVGYVDEGSSWVVGYGKLDNGTEAEVDGNTIFEIGSTTKTFTALLLQDMVARGEMRLDDPVAKYLPDSVTLPSRGGKQITLLNLAAQDSGLPFNADNMEGRNWAERFAGYDEHKLYVYLSGCTPTQEPGEQYQYSNVGMGLLGHIIARHTGRSYESLVVDRICRPLGMNSTRITLTPELKSRLAVGHDSTGKQAASFEFDVLAGTGALRSTVDDLLKYVSAQIGLTQTELAPLMQRTQEIRHRQAPVPAMDGFFGATATPWIDAGVYKPPGTELLGHPGGTGGYSAFIGFDKKQRRGVVVLFNQSEGFIPSMNLGWRILQRAPLTHDGVALGAVRETVGIGAAFDLDKANGALRITRVFAESPAAQVGLRAGMLVQKINDVSTNGKTLVECIPLLRGPTGSTVRLEIVDSQSNESKVVEVTRGRYKIG